MLLLSLSSAALAETTDTTISRLLNSGQIAAARAVLEAQAPSEADRLFFEGRVLKTQKRFDDAITVFRRVLQIDPNYTNARRELAHTLMLNRDFSAAKYHFNALMQIDANPRMRDGYQTFLNTIDAMKPAGVSGQIAILPSTNVNRGTDNLVFDTTLGRFVIDPSSRAESGVGLQLGASGFLRQPTSATARLSVDWSIYANRYQNSAYNSLVGNIALTLEQITKHGRWKVSPYARMTLREDDADNRAFGVNLGYTHRLSSASQLEFELSHEIRTFPVLTYQDGTFTSASATYSHQLSPSFSFRAGLGFERSTPEAAHLQYDAYRAFGEASKTWKGGLQTSFGLEVGLRDFVGDYPLTGAPREDGYLKISAGVQNSKIDLNGFTPRLSCSHTMNRSNVAFYDYTASECQAVLSRDF